MGIRDGVTKYTENFTEGPPVETHKIRELDYWRGVLYSKNLIGHDALRYGGVGFGNVSRRLEPQDLPRNKRIFVVTGNQTNRIARLTNAHYTTVLEYYPDTNTVVSEGPIRASSESMTHGKVYDCGDDVRFVFHAHSPHIWQCSRVLEIPTTKEIVQYGTPEMAKEVERLWRETNVGEKGIFSMGGHEDGIVTFGKTANEAGSLMLKYLSQAVGLLRQ